MARAAILIGAIVLALPACASAVGEPEQDATADGVVMSGSGSVIETPDHGPMIAWTFATSDPPQGGVLPLSNWNWGEVDGEQSSGPTTWGGPYDLVGVWDGAEFTLTESAVAVPAGAVRFEPGGTDCTDPALSDTVEFLRALDRKALGLGSRGSRLIVGECVAFVEAYFDSPELRGALAPVSDDVHVDLYFRALADPSPDSEDVEDSLLNESLLDGLTFLALPADGIDPAVSISFADGQLTYRSNCNSLFGPFSIDNGVLVFETGGSTLVGCDEPDSMSIVGELLTSKPSVQLDPTGALKITGPDRTLVVRSDATAEPTFPIIGVWRVASVLLGQGAESAWVLTSAAITIEPDRILIDGPCTDGTTTAVLDGRRLTVTGIDFEPGSCDEQGTEIEAALLDVFSSPTGEGVAFDVITTRAGIRLEPVIAPAQNDFRPVGLRLVPSE